MAPYASAYGYGYGYAPAVTSAQCNNGCQSLPAIDRDRIIACVFATTTCVDQLACD